MFHALIAAFMQILALFGLAGTTTAPVSLPPPVSTTTSDTVAVATSSVVQSTADVPDSSSASSQLSPSLPQGSSWLDSLPLGDGKYSTAGPQKGYVYLCHIAQGGGGAQGSATWIHGSSWTPSEKVAVSGGVSWPNAAYSMTRSGSQRIIVGNGLPTDHATGVFPIQRSDPAYRFDANPNSIKVQSYNYSLPAYPTAAATPGCIYGQVGIMDDGVALFDGFDAEYRDAVAHETQDQWEAHPDQAGVYHYHGFESGYVKDPVSQVVGFAFDGYPITGSQLPSGNYVHTADLDECHGMTSSIMLDGKEMTMYHYVLTQDFPYSVSCFHGASHEPKPGMPAAQSPQSSAPQGQGGQPPQAAVAACSGQAQGASCSFATPSGTVSGTCRTPPGETSLACVPQ